MFAERLKIGEWSVASVLGLACLLLAAPMSAQGSARGAECGDERQYSSIGVDAYHCPGGVCRFGPRASEAGPVFELTTEPWLRAIDPRGPGGGQIEEGDVLVAVNGLLITSASGGRELAQLGLDRDARLTVRRGERLVELDVRPMAACQPPLILIGNSSLVAPTARRSEFRAADRSVRTPDGDTLIDFTVPHRTRGNALDMSLGMTLRCEGCQLDTGERRSRWIVSDYPVVELVEPDGVADEAGLRRGDRVVAIAGQDLRTRRGGQLLFDPPDGDFDLSYERGGKRRKAKINRHIVDQRIKVVIDQRVDERSAQRQVVRVRRADDSWNDGVLASIARWWADLWRRGELDGLTISSANPFDGFVASGESWGPAGLGLLFEAATDRLFESTVDDGDVTFRLFDFPVVAHVEVGSPGHAAGLRVGDVVRTVDGHDVREEQGAELLLFFRADRDLRIGYDRYGQEGSALVVGR